MKKIILSVAVATMALSTSAFAADKGIDITTTGQAVIYYQTHDDDGATSNTGLGSQNSSVANVGLQLNLDADLKNGFTFGSQLTYLGTAGLEKNLVGGSLGGGPAGIVQSANTGINNTGTEIALTKIFVAKTIDNTTVKVGRQELPKSLSPFAFSEGWRVFKNTFDAAIVINSDIPDTTLVGAYVAGGTGSGDLGTTGDLQAQSTVSNKHFVDGAAYMLTAQNKSIPMTTVTASYYDLDAINSVALAGVDIEATALWADASIASKDLPMGLKIGLQGGMISPDGSKVGLSAAVADTMAMGARVSIAPLDGLRVCLAYTSVDGDDNKLNVAMKNTGTTIKTPLYTQMILNQDAIALDADTFMVKAAYNTGDYGTIIAQYAGSSAGKSNIMGSEKDYAEFDVIYKIKAGGVQYFASYMNRNVDAGGKMGVQAAADAESDNVVRAWARYNF